MTILVSATFAVEPETKISVTVRRQCATALDNPTWIVTVRDSTNVVLVRLFSSVSQALDFASKALKTYAP